MKNFLNGKVVSVLTFLSSVSVMAADGTWKVAFDFPKEQKWNCIKKFSEAGSRAEKSRAISRQGDQNKDQYFIAELSQSSAEGESMTFTRTPSGFQNRDDHGTFVLLNDDQGNLAIQYTVDPHKKVEFITPTHKVTRFDAFVACKPLG